VDNLTHKSNGGFFFSEEVGFEPKIEKKKKEDKKDDKKKKESKTKK
jgi:hypothetical protein